MKLSPTLHRRWPLLLAALTAASGILISLNLRSRVAQTESTTAQLTAETLRLNTQQELELFGEVLESVGALHALSDAVDQAAMDEFIKKGMVHQHTVLGGFGLIQRITPPVRFMMEQETISGSGTGYRVVRAGPDGTWTPAGPQPFHYPLTWESRPNALNVPIGFDFSSDPAAFKTIRQIEQTRRAALVPAAVPRRTEDGPSNQQPATSNQHSPLPEGTPSLRSATSPAPSYWVFAPVIPTRIEPNTPYHFGNVVGFSVATLHPQEILKQVSSRSGISPQLNLRLATPDDPPAGTIRKIAGQWLYSHPLEALDTSWIFECSLPVTGSGYHSTAAFFAGVIITVLVTALFLLIGGRTLKIEAEVSARTEDLRVANARLEENLHERVRLEEEMSELAARERRQIGSDLHDSLGQKLTGAVFLSRSLLDYFSNKGISNIEQGILNVEGSAVAKAMADKQESEIPNLQSPIATQQSHAKTLNETLKSAVAQVRNMARGLAPVTLNDESLGEALEQLAEEMTGLYGVSCEFLDTTARSESLALPRDSKSKGGATSSADVDKLWRDKQTEPNQQKPHSITSLSQKTKEQLYLIAREAVNNAARHAQAGRITVRLTGDESGWTLSVKDDGKGLPEPQSSVLSPQSSEPGMGIRIMRHRASLIDAVFALTSTPGKGTMVEIKSDK